MFKSAGTATDLDNLTAACREKPHLQAVQVRAELANQAIEVARLKVAWKNSARLDDYIGRDAMTTTMESADHSYAYLGVPGISLLPSETTA